MVFHRFLHSYSWVLIPLSSVDMPASESAGPVDVVIGLHREGQPAPPSSIRTFEAEVNKRPACPLEPEKRTVCKRPMPAVRSRMLLSAFRPNGHSGGGRNFGLKSVQGSLGAFCLLARHDVDLRV